VRPAADGAALVVTRLRLAALLCVAAVAAVTPVDDAFARYGGYTACRTEHGSTRDVVKLKTTVGETRALFRRAAAAQRRRLIPRRRFRSPPVEGAKVLTFLKDLTPSNGDNVATPGGDSARTNENGVARTRHRFTKFGRYRVYVRVKVGGDVVDRYRFSFRFADRKDGGCDDLQYPPGPEVRG
jgi:hypothetical protein